MQLLPRYSLQPLTNELVRGNASSPTPKALVPIVNRPMIFYPLGWLQDAHVSGMSEAIAVML